MSMIGNFAAANDEQIAALLDEPDEITSFLDGAYDTGDGGRRRGGLRHIDIDKAWHAIHFLLTGDAWAGPAPLDFIIRGGDEVGDVDVGYGPARAFTSAQVRALAAALAPIDRATLLARWDADAFRAADIYGVDPAGSAEENAYVGSHFDDLKAFVAGLARDGLGLIVYCC